MPKPISEREIQERVIIKSETREPKEEFYGNPYDTDLKLSGKEKKKMGTEIIEDIKKSIEDSGEFFDKLEEWNSLYEGDMPSKNSPWEGCSNTNVPVSTVRLDGIVNKIEQGIAEVIPNFMIKSEKLEDDKVEAIEKLLQQRLDKLEFRVFLEQILHNAGKQRTGVCVLRWDKVIKRRRGVEVYVDLEEFKKEYPNAKAAGLSDDEYAKIVKNIKVYGKDTVQIEYNQVEEHPCLEVINRQEFVLVPSNACSIEEARGKFMAVYITYQDLLKGIQNEVYKESDIEVLKRVVGEDALKEKKQEDVHISRQGQSEEEVSGIQPMGKEGRLMYVGMWKHDINGDDIEEDIMVTVDYETGVVLRSEAYPYWNGEPYFYDVKLKSRVKQFDGISIVERLAPLQYEINTQHNQRIDAWTQIINKIYLIDDNATLNPNPTNQRLKPGQAIRVSGVVGGLQNAIQELVKLPTGVPNFIQEEQTLLKYSDEIVGFSTLMTGQESPTDPNAPATKTIALLNEASTHIANYVRHVRVGLNRIARGLLWLEYQFGEDEYDIEGVKLIKQDLNPDEMEIDIRASEQSLNRALLLNEAVFMLQTLLSVQQVAQNQYAVKELVDNLVKKSRYDGNREVLTMTNEELTNMLYQRFEEMQEQQRQEQIAGEMQGQLDAVGATTDEVQGAVNEMTGQGMPQ